MGTLIIAGQPGVGKTTLARMLILMHASQNRKIHVVDDIAEAFVMSSAGEKRLILFDDFLGQVKLSLDHIRSVDQRLPPFLERVRHNRNLRFILTTREYIWNQANVLSDKLSKSGLEANKFVLNVGVYTRAIRAKILYNHLYFSGIGPEKLRAILADRFVLKIIDHLNFNPRLVQHICRDLPSSLGAELIRGEVERVLDNPSLLWDRPYREHINDGCRAVLLCLLIFRNSAAVDELRGTFYEYMAKWHSGISKTELAYIFARSLKELEGSMIAIANGKVSYSNPGVRDFLISVVKDDDLLSALVCCSGTLKALKQCYLIAGGDELEPRLRSDLGPVDVWLDAIARSLDASLGASKEPLVDWIGFLVDLHSAFAREEILSAIRLALEGLSKRGIAPLDIGQWSYLLEFWSQNQLPTNLQELLRNTLLDVGTRLLRDEAHDLSLENLEAVEEILFRGDFEVDVPSNAMHVALSRFVQHIDGAVYGLDTFEELDDFEESLKSMLERVGYAGRFPTAELSKKRDKLLEDEVDREDRGFYKTISEWKPPSQISDDEIMSLFDGLADR
jgi:energy-coupling factor transporter ATP-binding protein EcfA2